MALSCNSERENLLLHGMMLETTDFNSFMWPMIVTNTDAMRTVQVGLYTFNNDTSTRYDLLMAAATIIILPLMLLFIFARKKIVSAFSHGGIKG